eukprot:363664-Chlamydomonas_euryale.AAC.19
MPGWPDFDLLTASIARKRMVLTHLSTSSLEAVGAATACARTGATRARLGIAGRATEAARGAAAREAPAFFIMEVCIVAGAIWLATGAPGTIIECQRVRRCTGDGAACAAHAECAVRAYVEPHHSPAPQHCPATC